MGSGCAFLDFNNDGYLDIYLVNGAFLPGFASPQKISNALYRNNKGTTIHHCSLRFGSVNRPVEVGGVTVRLGDVIHAGSEGVIRVPSGCLETLAAKAVQMLAFESEAHCLLRRSNVAPGEKRRFVAGLLGKYGFAK